MPLPPQGGDIRRLQERVEELEALVQAEGRRADIYMERASVMRVLTLTRGGSGSLAQPSSSPLAQTGPCIRLHQAGQRRGPRRAASSLTQSAPLVEEEDLFMELENNITITKKEYELLLLKDQAISVLNEGQCSTEHQQTGSLRVCVPHACPDTRVCPPLFQESQSRMRGCPTCRSCK
jgi:hypothetical protein